MTSVRATLALLADLDRASRIVRPNQAGQRLLGVLPLAPGAKRSDDSVVKDFREASRVSGGNGKSSATRNFSYSNVEMGLIHEIPSKVRCDSSALFRSSCTKRVTVVKTHRFRFNDKV